MKVSVYRLRCLSNLHVGSGEVSYSIIDNTVQRDLVSQEPVIPASGVKGALREDLSRRLCGGSEEWQIDRVFGREILGEKHQAGTYRFLPAELLARPLRVSDGEMASVQGSCIALLERFADLCRALGVREQEEFVLRRGVDENEEKRRAFSLQELSRVLRVLQEAGRAGELPLGTERVLEVEGIARKGCLDRSGCTDEQIRARDLLSALLCGEVFVLGERQLAELPLPVSARNNVDPDNPNLWFEELVPHGAVFFLPVLAPEEPAELCGEHGETWLDEQLEGRVVQFGGNASVGQGLVQLERLVTVRC